MHFFGETVKATFLSRPNRFAVYCRLEGRKVKAFLPNPGRLSELLFPGTELYLEKASPGERATPYTAVAILKGSVPIVLHTHKANDVVRFLIQEGRVPGLEGFEVVRGEVTRGQSRFDFLLRKDGQDLLLEVKSCTLFSERMAMFPDAVTSRGKRHVEELAELSGRNCRGAVLFLVHHPRVEFFLPEYHTDLEFSHTLFRARKKIAIIPLAIQWKKDLSLGKKTRVLPIPWKIHEREAEDRGSYLIILKLEKAVSLEVGKLGRLRFKKGYYIYVGSAMAGLSRRIERHRRLRKKKFWHIDYLRAGSEFHAGLPVLAKDDLECEMAKALHRITLEEIPGFGSSDCQCSSHLFRVDKDPLDSKRFHAFLQHVRMERLLE